MFFARNCFVIDKNKVVPAILLLNILQSVQDMPSLYFALLNKAMAVEEFDATKA
jgi:hypothetical protein